MIRKKFVTAKATITDGSNDVGIYTYTGRPVTDERLAVMMRREMDNPLYTLKGIIREEKTYQMDEKTFIENATIKED